MKEIDKLYIQDEIEIFKPPEFILTCPNHPYQLPETPTLISKHSTSNIPSDYLGSTPTSEHIRENPFNPPDTTERPPYWTTHLYTQGETNLVNKPTDISSDTTLSSLPETLSLPSTPSISQNRQHFSTLISPPILTLDTKNSHRQTPLYG